MLVSTDFVAQKSNLGDVGLHDALLQSSSGVC